MNVQMKTEAVHAVCTTLCVPFFSLLKKRLFSVCDPRCLFLKLQQDERFLKHALYCLDDFLFYLKSVSYPGGDYFALLSVELSLYVFLFSKRTDLSLFRF